MDSVNATTTVGSGDYIEQWRDYKLVLVGFGLKIILFYFWLLF